MPLAERQLIRDLRRTVRKSSTGVFAGRVISGIGDDCAVVRIAARRDLLVTTDFSLEGVHFRRDWHPPESAGHRCLARGLSDIAAMGGEPEAVFLSLALPPKLPQKWVDQFHRGLLRLAAQFKVALAGGDTGASQRGILADIVVVGSVPAGKAIMRSGARPGDGIYVTGALGGAAAALKLLMSGEKVVPAEYPGHFQPMPRIDVGRILRTKKIAASMIDISDGLSTDVSHICEESGVGAAVWEGKLPRAIPRNSGAPVEVGAVLHGGDDYELLFTARPETRVPHSIAGVPITCIGEVTQAKNLVLVRSGGGRVKLEPRGWEHFRHASH